MLARWHPAARQDLERRLQAGAARYSKRAPTPALPATPGDAVALAKAQIAVLKARLAKGGNR
jgi:hypothetical protein